MVDLDADKVVADLNKASQGEEFARLVNAKQLKALVKAAGLRAGGEFHAALTKSVVEVLAKAAARCVGGKRVTLQGEDLFKAL